MIDIQTKINNDPTSAGAVEDFEYNDTFRELKNAVKAFMALNPQDEKQLSKSIDIASKALHYGDIGSVNNVILTRIATSDPIETLVDGMVFIFSAANENTGASTLKLNALDTKAILHNSLPLEAGVLKVGSKYIAIYSLSANSFNIDLIAGDGLGFGTDQFLVDKSLIRTPNVSYTNLTTRPIQVLIDRNSSIAISNLYINTSVIAEMSDGTGAPNNLISMMIPVGFSYRLNDSFKAWHEITSDLVT